MADAEPGDLFRALADPTRRAILDELRSRNVQTLFEICSRLAMNHGISPTRQAISQHLDLLESAGLVVSRREGRYKFHEFDPTPLQSILDRWPAQFSILERNPMKIHLTSVFVDDQDKALAFYTSVLGFALKTEVPLGEFRWLTVVSPNDPNGVELVLEPDNHPAVKPFKDALQADGIPFTSFAVDDVDAETARLKVHGVRFVQEPAAMGPVITAVFDDTCGNLLQITAPQ